MKTREIDDAEIVDKHTDKNKITKHAENEFFKLIYLSIKKEKTTAYDYQNLVQNILFLKKIRNEKEANNMNVKWAGLPAESS